MSTGPMPPAQWTSPASWWVNNRREMPSCRISACRRAGFNTGIWRSGLPVYAGSPYWLRLDSLRDRINEPASRPGPDRSAAVQFLTSIKAPHNARCHLLREGYP